VSSSDASRRQRREAAGAAGERPEAARLPAVVTVAAARLLVLYPETFAPNPR
jgi:hypothetical protein